MRIRLARLAALFLAIGLVAPLFAQRQPGGGFGRGMDGSALLSQKSVQEELKLTEDQITKVTAVGKDLREKYADDLKDKDKRQETMKKMGEARTKALAGILKPEQTKRLHQIEVQVGGLNALTKDDVAKTLSLTEKQIADAKGIEDDLRKDAGELFKGGDKDKFAETMAKVQTLRKEAATKFISGLSAEQKKAYKELTGDEFKGKLEAPTGGRPRPNKTDK